MIKHVILWKLRDDLTDPTEAKLEIKNNLESLVGKIPGLIEAKVIVDCLDSSTEDCMLITLLESEEALKAYAVNPLHMDIVNNVVKPKVVSRIAFDYEV